MSVAGAAGAGGIPQELRADGIAVNKPVTAPNHRLLVAKRRPGKGEPGPEVILVCREESTTGMARRGDVIDPAEEGHLRIHAVRIECGQIIMAFPKPAINVIAQSDVEGEVGVDWTGTVKARTAREAAMIPMIPFEQKRAMNHLRSRFFNELSRVALPGLSPPGCCVARDNNISSI